MQGSKVEKVKSFMGRDYLGQLEAQVLKEGLPQKQQHISGAIAKALKSTLKQQKWSIFPALHPVSIQAAREHKNW